MIDWEGREETLNRHVNTENERIHGTHKIISNSMESHRREIINLILFYATPENKPETTIAMAFTSF